MSHYFIADDSLEDHITTIPFHYKNTRFVFTTNSGMFSPRQIDEATALLLHHIPPLSGTLLDLACGYGVVGIVLGKTYSLDVTMSDINERALEYATINSAQNQVDASIVVSDCFMQIHGSFDTVVLNPPIHAGKSVIFELYEQSFAHLNAGGAFYVVIKKKHGANSTLQKLNELFGSCTLLYSKKGDFVIACKKPGRA